MVQKTIKVITAASLASSMILSPLLTTKTEASYTNFPTNWTNVQFTPYTWNDGTPIYDPANEPGISPDNVDFVSGYEKGSGDKPSFYVASDGTNMFFRMRILGDPYDRKGGFLSSVWLVDLAIDGVHKATVGVDGKSPHEDFIYVSNPNGVNVKKISVTDSTGSSVPGTRIMEAENGQYFLDFQVPISAISEVAPEITANSNVQFFFGTSKAHNHAVINKDYLGPSSMISYASLAKVNVATGKTLLPTILFSPNQS